MSNIHKVSVAIMSMVIETRVPEGLFLASEKNRLGYDGYAAVDNSSGDAWAEWFRDEEEAIDWLNGEFEISDIN